MCFDFLVVFENCLGVGGWRIKLVRGKEGLVILENMEIKLDYNKFSLVFKIIGINIF